MVSNNPSNCLRRGHQKTGSILGGRYSKTRACIFPEMAIRVAKAFGGAPDVWYGMQSAYDIAQAKKTAGKIKVKAYKPVKLQVGGLDGTSSP